MAKFFFFYGWVIFLCGILLSIPHRHSIFILSSIDEHLGCFPMLAIADNTAMSVGVLTSSQINVLFSSDKYPGVELPDHMVLLFNFLRNLATVFL